MGFVETGEREDDELVARLTPSGRCTPGSATTPSWGILPARCAR